jgi:hypothetical protein
MNLRIAACACQEKLIVKYVRAVSVIRQEMQPTAAHTCTLYTELHFSALKYIKGKYAVEHNNVYLILLQKATVFRLY